MLDPTTNSTPTAAPASAPPNIPAAPAPDISALMNPAPAAQPMLDPSTVQPSAPPPVDQTAALQAQIAPLQANELSATKRATDLANAGPVTPPNVPHARLMNMISGLALGLDSFGKAIATHGREGGAQEVQQVEAERQQQQLQAKQAAQQALNFKVQQQLTIADTNRQTAQNILLLSTLPTDLKLKDLQVKTGEQGLATSEADFRSSHFGLSPTEYNDTMSGKGATATGTGSDVMRGRIQQIADAAAQNPELGPADPYVKQAQAVLADPKSSARDLMIAAQNLQNQQELKKGVTAARTAAIAGLPKNQQEAAAQLADAQKSGDSDRIAKAQSIKDSIDQTVQGERKFASDLQEANNRANKQLAMQNTLAQKGVEDTNKLWTDPQHGFTQTAAQVGATKNAIAQAKNGSELAASLEPAMITLGVNSFAGVHRISPTEYEAAGPQVGSLYRRLNALLDKAGSGAVPADTLTEANQILDALVQTKYTQSIASTRQIAANSGIQPNKIFVPNANDYGTLTTLDQATGAQSSQPGSTPKKFQWVK